MLHSAKDNATPQQEWQGIVDNNPVTRIPIAWFYSTFGTAQVTNGLALARNETLSNHSFLSNNGVKVIGASFNSWDVPMKYPKEGMPDLNRGLAWKSHLDVKALSSNKEYGVDWLHGSNQVKRHVPHLRSNDRRNASFRD